MSGQIASVDQYSEATAACGAHRRQGASERRHVCVVPDDGVLDAKLEACQQ